MNHFATPAGVPANRFGNMPRRLAKKSYTISELIQIGNALHKKGDLTQAESVFRKVLEVQPDHPAALHFLGVIAHQSEQYDAAIKLMKKAIAVAPAYSQAYNNLGNVYEAKGEPEKAVEVYERALELNPDYIDAYFNLGVVLRQLLRFEEARDAFQTCMELEPRRADVHFELGQTQQKLGDRMEAQISYQIALNIDPDHVESRLHLGNVLSTLGRTEEAVEAYEEGLMRDPEHIRLLNSLGVAQRKVGRFETAVETSLKAYELDPNNIETLNTLGAAYQTLGDNDKAAEVYWRALKIMPEAECAHKCLLFVALNMPHLSSEELFDIHRQVRGHFDRPELAAKTFSERDRDPERRIRIGYMGSDFRTHVVAMNILPVIANHDHENFEIFLYSQVEFPDDVTKRFQDFADHWRVMLDRSNEDAAKMIEADEIDILVTLAGRFDENRPIVPSFRPAPIQVSYHDCATSGIEAMDYWLTDEILHPAGTPEKFTENLYRLPAYYQYPIQEGLPGIKPPPALENGFITFGCCNKPEKINEAVVELWAKVLKAVPNSKLLLKYFNHYSQKAMREKFEGWFAKYGIHSDRLILKAGMDDRRNHLVIYDQVDIALDPFPFNGATTTFESLTMGIPVVALLGRHFVDRVAASIVTHAGYPELVANSTDDYVGLATRLAGDLESLGKLRLEMRDRLHRSALCQNQTYAKNVEDAFRDMWRYWCETGGYREV